MNFCYRLGWIFFRTYFGLYSRTRYFNPGRVPTEGGVILAANHASFLDPPLVGSGLSRMVSYLGRDTLFDVPVLAAMLRSVKVVPINREGGGADGVRVILDRLQDGGVILLFPEGTRTPDGRLHPPRSGIGLTVMKSVAPVVPVRVVGTFEAFGRHLKWPRPRRLQVHYGEPMHFEELRAEAKTCAKPRLKQIYQEVAAEVMEAIANLGPGPGKA